MPAGPECGCPDYRAFFENAPCGMFECSEGGRFLTANPALADILGYDSPEALVGQVKSIDDELFLGTGDYHRIFAEAEENGSVVDEHQVLCADGSLIWVEIKVRIVETDGKGRVLEGYVTDITEQKRSQWLIEEKEELYKGVYEHSIEGLFQCTPGGRLVSGSPSMAGCFGYDSFEDMTAEAPELGALLEDPRDFLDLAGKLKSVETVTGLEVKARKRGGGSMWVSINARAHNDADGRPVLFQGSVNEITGRKTAERKLDYQAAHDTLTGLMNRRMFTSHLEKALARLSRNSGYSFALIFADLDRFKIINESLGYEIGDKALVELARRTGSVLRGEDVLARLGSDKFAVFIEGAGRAVDAVRVAERILKVFETPFVIDEHEVFLNMSMGIALGREGCGDAGQLLSDAEQAMNKAKKNPHLRYFVLDESMQSVALERLCLETDLRKGLDRDEFRLFYQPVVDLGSGEVVGMEALMRWEHPVRKMVRPNEFIPVAEETGMIIPLGYKALKQACDRMREWSRMVDSDPPKTVAVNLSAKQFMKSDLLDDVKRVLDETGLDGNRLKLEVTESAVMANPEAARELLAGLKELGVGISIDDFGTGYSSLSYLKHLPSDILKIDRSFISDIEVSADNRSIAATIVTLADSLGLDVVAEGVEKVEHWRILASMGVRYGQGFYFSPPVEAERARKLLEKRYTAQ
jgi:diguanylate cyclase (GGDEF)-like protein/PAS domain S-box-containing protein